MDVTYKTLKILFEKNQLQVSQLEFIYRLFVGPTLAYDEQVFTCEEMILYFSSPWAPHDQCFIEVRFY